MLNSGSGGVKYTGTGDQAVGNAIVAATKKQLQFIERRQYYGIW